MQKNCFRKGFYSVKILIKWLVIGTMVGLIVGTVCSLFGHALIFAKNFRAQNSLIVLGLPVAGLVIVFLYRFFKDEDDKGTNMVITSIQSSTDIPFRMMPLIFVSTVLTHLCGGSAGREGAALQIGGSIANRLGKVMKLNEDDRHVIIMCGMSAGFSALFGTPMAAAVFSMEVVRVGVMHYAALVPCVTGALIGHFVAQYFRVPPEVFPVTGVQAMDPWEFIKVAAFAAMVAVVSIIFCVILHTAEHLYEKYFRNPYLRIAVAGCMVVLLSIVLRTDFYLGSGMGIIEHIFHEGNTEWYTFLLKMIFTALTLGAGFKGGEIVPSFCIGAAFGCAVAPLFGLPVSLVAACGMVGLFCGVTNSPLTSLLIAFELFGFEGMPYFLVTIAVSYMLSGYFGLYRSQRIMYSKTEDQVVDTSAH